MGISPEARKRSFECIWERTKTRHPAQPIAKLEEQVYIIEEERGKCQKVADVFVELYEMENIVVVDAGRYGFGGLKYYKSPHGFEDAITFTGGVALFEDLWGGMAEYKAVPDGKRYSIIGKRL